MKAAIVTFVRAYNYGAVLQCYALNSFLHKIGVQSETLDYYPDYFKREYSMEWETSFRRPLKSLRELLLRIYCRLIIAIRNCRFERFIEKYIPLSSSQYSSVSNLNKAQLDYDCYLAGSDQIWHSGCSRFDPVYFLDFSDAKRKPRYSYAASFGGDNIQEELKSEYVRRLTGFIRYSVREQSGAKLIEAMLHEKATVCCDPTLLLSSNDWEKLCGIRKERRPYILVYYVTRTKVLQEYAKKLSEQRKMKVICVACNMSIDIISGRADRKFGFDFRGACSPEDFVKLFRDAEYVLTNSFHGTVFSVIFHKQFLVQTQLDSGQENTRAVELMNILGISCRDLQANFRQIDDCIQWQEVDRKREDLTRKAKQYLLGIQESMDTPKS